MRRRIAFVPFLPDGSVGLIPGSGGRVSLPEGDLEEGEHPWDGALRIPMTMAGYRYQGFHNLTHDPDHLWAWLEGDRYRGHRPHAKVDLVALAPAEAAVRLRAQGDAVAAAKIEEAVAAAAGMTDDRYWADCIPLLERAYLRADTPEGGSGFSRGPDAWRENRQQVTDGIDRSGTFVDVGCANGLLMESVVAWCAERSVVVEPFGVDLSTELVDLARRRLPHWAGRIFAGNAITWVHPEGLRFDFVHTLTDCVPPRRVPDLIRHHLGHLLAPGGRLLVSAYGAGPISPHARTDDFLASHGYSVAGWSGVAGAPGTAWIDSGPATYEGREAVP